MRCRSYTGHLSGSPGSVRRALDVGWSAAEMHEFLGTVSRTPVPQPLTYLVDDTVRTFGPIRVGHTILWRVICYEQWIRRRNA